MAFNKSSLILGGAGSLGRAMVSTFKAGGWSVVNMDLKENSEANTNIIVKDTPMKVQVSSLADQVRSASGNYDAIIIASGSFEAGSVKDDNIFEVYDKVDRMNFQSALLGGHLASHFLA